MRTIQEPSRTLNVVAEADVVVAGGGPGGLPAAIAAARHGATVVLIERYGFLGGLATAGLIAPILGHTASKSHRPVVEGILKEMTGRMHAIGGATAWDDACREWGINFDAEAFKRVADAMVREAGIRLLLHTLVTDAVVEDGCITALTIENKSGRAAVAGKVFIDATGDADVAFRAGAPTTQGRPFDGRVQAMGSFIHLGGVPEMTEEAKQAAMDKVRAAIEDGRLHFYHAQFIATNDAHSDHLSPNMTRWAGNPTNADDLTAAELDIRRDAWELAAFLRAEIPGFENCYIRATSGQAGVRESRQVQGDYILTGDDVHQGRKFDDGIARSSYWIDIHCPLGKIYPVHLCTTDCIERDKCPFWTAEHDKTMFAMADLYPPDDDWHDVPYRSLTAKGLDNLLVSGRCISATHEAMSAFRVMGTCMAIGQAAGTAAALAARSGGAVRSVDARVLRDTLTKDGALV